MKQHSIYFLRGETSGRIKIGFAECPIYRQRAIQHNCTERLEIVGLIELGVSTRSEAEAREFAIQTSFQFCHAYGEIFNPSTELSAFIKLHATDKHSCSTCPADPALRNPWNRRSGNKGKVFKIGSKKAAG